MRFATPLALVGALWLVAPATATDTVVTTSPATGASVLAQSQAVAPLFVSDHDWPGVQRAARDLQADVERVTGLKPELASKASKVTDAVIIGTVGKSALIDQLVSA